MEILNKINETRTQLEFLLISHDLNDKKVVEVSQKLDKLILEYYKEKDKADKKQNGNLSHMNHSFLEAQLEEISIEEVI